jgi:hypothetical protein
LALNGLRELPRNFLQDLQTDSTPLPSTQVRIVCAFIGDLITRLLMGILI